MKDIESGSPSSTIGRRDFIKGGWFGHQPLIQLTERHADRDGVWAGVSHLSPDVRGSPTERAVVGLLDIDDGRSALEGESCFSCRSHADQK